MRQDLVSRRFTNEGGLIRFDSGDSGDLGPWHVTMDLLGGSVSLMIYLAVIAYE